MLPSLNGLRAFETAARHMSFSRAADELNVTQTAVSHPIRRLEEQIRKRLFVRKNRALALTRERLIACRRSAPPSTICGAPRSVCSVPSARGCSPLARPRRSPLSGW
jgi:DNA-binding Lrp family transcriptional regulator